MRKIVVVEKCFDCPHCVANEYTMGPDIWVCAKNNNRALPAPNCNGGIPEWCLLQDYNEGLS